MKIESILKNEKETEMSEVQNRQNNSNWLPWALFGIAILALAGFLFFAGNDENLVEKQSYTVTNENGVTGIIIKNSLSDFSYVSDEVAQMRVKDTKEKKSYERAEKKRVQNEVFEKNSVLQQVVEEQKKMNKNISSIDSRIGNLEKEINKINGNIIGGFDAVNMNLVSVNSSIGSVEKTVKYEAEKTRVLIRESILNLPHSSDRKSDFDLDSGSGYNKSQKR